MDAEIDGGSADSPNGTAAGTGPKHREFTPDRSKIDLSRDPHPGVPDHAAPDGAPLDPLIDLSRDPHPGVPDHAAPDHAGPEED